MKRLPSVQYGPFDDVPDPVIIGQRVAFPSDHQWIYGRVLAVNGRRVTLALEKRWGSRHQITMHWEQLRIADDQNSPPPAPSRPPFSPERVEYLRSKLAALLPSHHDSADKASLHSTAVALHEQLQDHLEALSAMRSRIHSLAASFAEARDLALASGVSHVPPAVETIRDVDVRFAKRPERNRHLAVVRSQTRTVLDALLVAAGTEGVSSEEVVAVLCTGAVSPHRIMGMLSAFSRKQYAVLQPNGKWRLSVLP